MINDYQNIQNSQFIFWPKCYFPQLCPNISKPYSSASKQKSLLLYNDTEISNFYRITFDIKDWYGPHLFFKLIEKHPNTFQIFSQFSQPDDHNCFCHTTKTCKNSHIFGLLKGAIGKKSIFKNINTFNNWQYEHTCRCHQLEVVSFTVVSLGSDLNSDDLSLFLKSICCQWECSVGSMNVSIPVL